MNSFSFALPEIPAMPSMSFTSDLTGDMFGSNDEKIEEKNKSEKEEEIKNTNQSKPLNKEEEHDDDIIKTPLVTTTEEVRESRSSSRLKPKKPSTPVKNRPSSSSSSSSSSSTSTSSSPPSSKQICIEDSPLKITEISSGNNPLFILIKQGPQEGFTKANKEILKYSIDYAFFAKALFYHEEVIQDYHIVYFAKDLKCALIARENLKYYHPKLKVYGYSIDNDEVISKIKSLNLLWNHEHKIQYQYILQLCSTHFTQVRKFRPHISDESVERIESESALARISNDFQMTDSNSNSNSSSTLELKQMKDPLTSTPKGTHIQ